MKTLNIFHWSKMSYILDQKMRCSIFSALRKMSRIRVTILHHDHHRQCICSVPSSHIADHLSIFHEIHSTTPSNKDIHYLSPPYLYQCGYSTFFSIHSVLYFIFFRVDLHLWSFVPLFLFYIPVFWIIQRNGFRNNSTQSNFLCNKQINRR